MPVTVKVSSKNQISLPAQARARLDIGPGDVLMVDIRDDSIVLMKESTSFVDHMRGFHKEIWEGVDAQEFVENERAAWKR